MCCWISGKPKRRFALPRSRKAGCEASLRFRSDCRRLRILAGRGRSAHSAGTIQVRPALQLRHGQTSTRNRNPERSSHYPAHVPEVNRKNRREAGGKDPFLPDAALVEASALFGRESRTLRPGGEILYPLHFADPPISGLDRAPHSERSVARR